MTHDEFLRRHGHGFRYVELWKSGWRPEDPLPERYEWMLRDWKLGGGSSRYWFFPRQVVWALRKRMGPVVRVRLLELCEQWVECQGEVRESLWADEPYSDWAEYDWVRSRCDANPVARFTRPVWELPRYVLPELVERIGDGAFWGYVWWLVMRGHPYCFDDYRVSRSFDVGVEEAERARRVMFDLGWFRPMKRFPEKHFWVRKPGGLVAME